MRSNMETQELKMECTVNLEGNCCHRAIISAKRQLGITDDKTKK